MTEVIKEIIEKIREGIEVDGEFELQLIDQMSLVNNRLNIADLCEERGWSMRGEDIRTSITISERL